MQKEVYQTGLNDKRKPGPGGRGFRGACLFFLNIQGQPHAERGRISKNQQPGKNYQL